jgi:oxygen-dependent protoporphyrinogen oxidase
MKRQLVIIGGGISGLAAAWFAQQAGLDYALFEASDRLGGKVLTERLGDFVVEAGPDSFLTAKPAALQLARDLGLADQLIPINTRPHATYVLRRGRPVALPKGMSLAVPTDLGAFLRSPLVSPPGKARVLLDTIIPPRRDNADESLADFVRRRLGCEALDVLAAPLMAGIHNADPERQSILATFPRYRVLERERGSLIRGLRAAPKPTTPGAPPFMALRDGTQALIDALTAQLTGDVRVKTTVHQIESVGARHHAPAYTLTTSTGEQFDADAVLIATPAYSAANLIASFAPEAAEILRAIRYLSSGTVSLAYREQDIRQPIVEGFGLVIAQSEHRPINAITISSEKFDHRAPAGRVLLRVFFGGARSPETLALDDDALLRLVRRELQTLLGIDAPPLFSRIFRWHNANPQYDVGHLERVAALEAALPPNLYLAGSAYRGVGLPDCIAGAKAVIETLTTRSLPQLEPLA